MELDEQGNPTKKRKASKSDNAGTSQSKEQCDLSLELFSRPLERLSMTVIPSCLEKLKSTRDIGFMPPVEQFFLEARYYEINVANFRNAILSVLTDYLTWNLVRQGDLRLSKIDSLVKKIAESCADACMSALYAKLHKIHKQYQQYYSSRFITRPLYSNDIELPLPFVDAVQQFGAFYSNDTIPRFHFIPIYPEGTKNEGRSKDHFDIRTYEASIPMLRQLGIPLKSINPCEKFGSSWWTYRIEATGYGFDFQCILPQSHYSDHSYQLSMMMHAATG